ncbi:Glu/Leu/Phe/Val dehydrogenase dimerization domain-containing protein [Actinoplanes sp. NPDC051470]|uniref:Glu/Leu/Phe/Val dehydrogenase dimerization domain-containing protein n=1 Tax=unclassified Actinoplanes TaxID=2626549 RepID=UPI0034327590
MNHERIVIERGRRTGLTIIVAVHSTERGQAIGGCRLKHYPDWRDGLTDALRLSEAMTTKAATAGLRNGGGKTVIVAPDGPFDRDDALRDAGDVIASLNGAYATGPDVGTGPADMDVIAERTEHVFCRPSRSGDPSEGTAAGTVAALRAVCAHLFGSPELAGRSFAVLGLGHVGSHLVRMLAERHAKLIVSDIDPARRAVAEEYGATWTTPAECFAAEVDVLVPAALGGLLTPATVPVLRCAAVAGPANNQLDAPGTADLLRERGILFAPDPIVSAGGIIHAVEIELHGATAAEAAERVDQVERTLANALQG